MISLEQRKAHLAKANWVRSARTQIKQDLKDGVIELDILLANPPEVCHNVPIFDLLQWRPRIGASGAKRMMKGIVFSETLLLGAASQRTLEQLAGRVRETIARYGPVA